MLEQGKESERRSKRFFAREEGFGGLARTRDEATERCATDRERREVLARAREYAERSWRSAV